MLVLFHIMFASDSETAITVLTVEMLLFDWKA
jgi:hypothetical protein